MQESQNCFIVRDSMKKITAKIRELQLNMIDEFVVRRYKELYDEDIESIDIYAEITTSPRGSVDFVYV